MIMHALDRFVRNTWCGREESRCVPAARTLADQRLVTVPGRPSRFGLPACCAPVRWVVCDEGASEEGALGRQLWGRQLQVAFFDSLASAGRTRPNLGSTFRMMSGGASRSRQGNYTLGGARNNCRVLLNSASQCLSRVRRGGE